MARKVQALYDFEAQGGTGELSIISGDILTVIRTDVGDGWWEGSNTRGESGLFPEAYVEEYSGGDDDDVSSTPSGSEDDDSDPPISLGTSNDCGELDGGAHAGHAANSIGGSISDDDILNESDDYDDDANGNVGYQQHRRKVGSDSDF